MTKSVQKKTVQKSPAQKLDDLRAQMKKHGIDAYLIPRADEFQGEYVPARAERLSWLTGFTGSAGGAAVLADKALVVTDGRYQIQVKNQIDGGLYETADCGHAGLIKTLGRWLADHMPGQGGTIGYDPKLYTCAEIDALAAQLDEEGGPAGKLLPVAGNLVDEIWPDQPAAPQGTVEIYPQSLAGKSALEKQDEVAEQIRAAGGKAAVLAAPDSIAWLLNIRGADVPHVPVALSYALLHEDGDVDWFIEAVKIDQAVKAHLGTHVRVQDPADMPVALQQLAATAAQAQKPVLGDYARLPVWFKMMITQGGAELADQTDPCVALKAIKTPEEQKALKAAHVRDGVAMVRFLRWLEQEAPKGKLTEMDVEDKLLAFRKDDKDFRDTSFDTIAGWGANGAIIHYRVTKASNTKIAPPGLLLVDSGGQYFEGTTDITRTMGVGAVSDEMKENFTRVLKGHIGIASLRFPEGITGKEIDVLARKTLWDAGLDYAHGTGHGVGVYLSVHEAGTGISSRANHVFKPGMLISNEPGYYKEGEYGIRIENLVLVQGDGRNQTTGKSMMRFETVTLAPIDTSMIVLEMLGAKERRWLDDYHGRVYKTLAPLLAEDDRKWLAKACAPLSGGSVPQAPRAPDSGP